MRPRGIPELVGLIQRGDAFDLFNDNEAHRDRDGDCTVQPHLALAPVPAGLRAAPSEAAVTKQKREVIAKGMTRMGATFFRRPDSYKALRRFMKD